MTTLPLEPVAAAPEPRWRVLRGMNAGDRLYRGVLTALALTLPLLLLALVGELGVSAWPAIRRFGLHFLWTSVWDPVAGVFGAAPMIFGTVASSLLALLLAVPLALGVAIYLTEFAPKWLRQPVAFVVELLAARAGSSSRRCVPRWAGRRFCRACSTETRCWREASSWRS